MTPKPYQIGRVVNREVLGERITTAAGKTVQKSHMTLVTVYPDGREEPSGLVLGPFRIFDVN
jgi:hypothetical protein